MEKSSPRTIKEHEISHAYLQQAKFVYPPPPATPVETRTAEEIEYDIKMTWQKLHAPANHTDNNDNEEEL